MKGKLVDMAKAKHGDDIQPVHRSWDRCWSEFNNMLLFWYDTPDKSTHMVCIPITEEE